MVENKQNADGGGDAEKKVSDVSDAEQKETKNSNKHVDEALQMCFCFPKIRTKRKIEKEVLWGLLQLDVFLFFVA